MATDTILMDYERIAFVSKSFRMVAQTMRAIAKALEVAIQALRAAAFASMGTSLKLAQYLDVIKQKLNNLAKVCEEFSKDLSLAISDHKQGDAASIHRFGEGV